MFRPHDVLLTGSELELGTCGPITHIHAMLSLMEGTKEGGPSRLLIVVRKPLAIGK